MLKLFIVDDEVSQVRPLSTVIHKLRSQMEMLQMEINEAYEGETTWNIVQSELASAVILRNL